MNRTQPSLLAIALPLLLVTVSACHDHSHDHVVAEEETPMVAVTNWTAKTELFMEYPVFMAGESGRSAIHVTDLSDFTPLTSGEAIVAMRADDDFTPLTSGEAIVAMRADDGKLLEFRGGISRPGIFGVDLGIEQPGSYDMTLRVDAPGLQDLHELGKVTVHAAGAPLDTAGEEDHGEISFLKEQQWKLEFGTEPVEARGLRSSIRVPASVRPRSGGEALISAPVPGRIDPATPAPVPGTTVRAGDLIARIIPRSDDVRDVPGLRAALVEAEQEHALALQERDRAARLLEARALPARRLNEAEAALAAAEARLKAARQRVSRFDSLTESDSGTPTDGAFTIRAPFDGVVAEVGFAPGASVDEEKFLLRIVDGDRVAIVGAVPEIQASRLNEVDSGEALINGGPAIPLGSPLAIGRVVEPASRTFDIRFSYDNRSGNLRVGQSVVLRLFIGEEQSWPAVPESAIVDDDGTLVVFVQAGGETFDRRPVTLGSREGGYVHVHEGVGPGERVVHKGAYLIRLAAMSTAVPAHGHVH
jgi:RND family efflux transporter MFP subunit